MSRWLLRPAYASRGNSAVSDYVVSCSFLLTYNLGRVGQEGSTDDVALMMLDGDGSPL